MTDIEAVGALKWKVAYAKEIGKSHIDNVYVEDLDLAVKALEERQQGDLISREALKKYARKVMCEKDFMTKIHLELFENIIDNAPPVETQKKGLLSIDDVISVFIDFMCDEVDGEGIAIFRKMLKNKAEKEGGAE